MSQSPGLQVAYTSNDRGMAMSASDEREEEVEWNVTWSGR